MEHIVYPYWGSSTNSPSRAEGIIMNNWTITSVSTEQVVDVAPVRTTIKRRLTKRGRAVVAIVYAVVTIALGIILGECLLKGLEAEGRMRDSQSAPYIQAMQQKEANRNAAQAF